MKLQLHTHSGFHYCRSAKLPYPTQRYNGYPLQISCDALAMVAPFVEKLTPHGSAFQYLSWGTRYASVRDTTFLVVVGMQHCVCGSRVGATAGACNCTINRAAELITVAFRRLYTQSFALSCPFSIQENVE